MDEETQKMVDVWWQHRRRRDFEKADPIRAQLRKHGVDPIKVKSEYMILPHERAREKQSVSEQPQELPLEVAQPKQSVYTRLREVPKKVEASQPNVPEVKKPDGGEMVVPKHFEKFAGM